MPLNLPVWKALEKKTVVLASASPRRPYVEDTAWLKVKEVWERCQTDDTLPKADVVIAADTIVVHKNQVLEKPKDAQDAYRILSQLSNDTHLALTAVHILAEDIHYKFVTTTSVTFDTLDEETIQEYINQGEPFDKAGAYGIQGPAALFISKVEGDYWNVVGLPQHPVYQHLVKLVKAKQWE
ncbi:unnamed protein product [Cunninghamella echinulata]